MTRKLTQTEFGNRLHKINPKIRVLGKYVNANSHIEVQCLICGHKWSPYASSLLAGHGCAKCNFKKMSNERGFSQKDFERKIHSINSKIRVLGKYNNATSHIKVQCLICGHKWSPYAGSLLAGHGCNICGSKRTGNKLRTSQQEFKKRVKQINSNIKILGKYVNAKNHIKVQCLICGHKWSPYAESLLAGHGCPKCIGNKRLTQREFIAKLKKINPKIKILEKYINYKTKIMVQCLVCKHQWHAIPSHLLQGRSCPKCAASTKRLTQHEFIAKLKKINPKIKILEKYINYKTKIMVQCLVCEHQWHTTPANLLQGHGCPKCAGNKKLTQREFIDKLKKINPQIKVTGHYINAQTKINAKCLVCGHRWPAVPFSLLRGEGCPKCGHKRSSNELKLTQAEFVAKLKRVSSKIKVIGKYANSQTPINIKCLVCGHKWSAIPNALLRGTGCPKCAGNKKLTQNEFITKLKKVNSKIKVIGKYINAKTPIDVKCLVCKHKWSTTPTDLLQGTGCPKCNKKESKGEQALEEYCQRHHYNYKWQYIIPECRYKKPLPFDIAIFNSDGSLNCLIEYEGWQHYLWCDKYHKKPHAFFSDKEVQLIHKRDMIKQDYCIKHHILLIYINHSGTTAEENKMSFICKLVKENLDGFLKVS